MFSFGNVTTYGSFFSGERLELRNYIRYRIQPWGSFELRYTVNRLNFSEQGSATYHLLAPRVEISFSNNLFWTLFVQYNTQSDNFNFNARLQWRFRPMSDFFLVISDNLYANSLQQKNFGVVAKVNYWLNL